MDIRIDKRRSIPLYRQIINQVIQQINQNILLKGDRLPSERKLAKDIGVNRSTVVRAYDELYAMGFVERKTNSGTFVLSSSNENFTDNTRRSLVFKKNSKDYSDPYILKIKDMFKRDNPLLIDGYTGELPFEIIPNISLPSFHWKDFLKEEDSSLGYLDLRRTVRNLVAKTYNYNPKEEEIMLTASGQQSLVLLIQALLKPGDIVAIEDPSFFSSMSLFKAMSIKVIKIQVDSNGLCVDELEEKLQIESIKLVLTNPNFQNPTGSSMSLKRRYKLVEICRAYRIPILEDDVFGQLSYQVPSQLPLLKQLAPDIVIYIGSLSKILGKRIQLGWIDAPSLVLSEVINLRDEYESELSIFPQVLASHALKDQNYLNQLTILRQQLKEQVDFFKAEMNKTLPTQMICSYPRGGYYVWLTYFGRKLEKEDWDIFLDNHVAVYPSFLNTTNAQSCRINIARLSKKQIKRMVRILKEICHEWTYSE